MVARWEYWYYTRRGTVRHALPYANANVAACGTSGWIGGWYGTGSQAEYERTAELPPCKRCVARGYKP
jgi:hypothetical protein